MTDLSNKAWVRMIMTVAKPVMNMKIVGQENILPEAAPAVYVCNHGMIYGAIAAMVHLPVHFRPWINEIMLDPSSAAKSMAGTLNKDERSVKRIAAIISSAMNSFDAIPVSRTNPMAMIETIKESVSALEGGDNLLIFPENPKEHYDKDSFRNLHPAFGILGYRYYQSTGKRLHFYPVFSDSVNKTFSIGCPVIYTPGGNEGEEAQRIVEEVQRRMIQLSEQK